MFMLRTSKTHGLGSKPQIIKISSSLSHKSDAQKFCPFLLLQKYLRIRKKYISQDEQFFIFKDRSPVLLCHFRNILANLIKICKLNPRLYSSHSLRSGRASDLLDLGVSVETIKKLGRWRPSSIYTYLRS